MRWFALFLPVVALAQDWGSLHIVQGDIDFSKRFTLQLHSRVRTNDRFGAYFQSRGGPIAFVKVNSRVSAIGGYYFIDEESGPGKMNQFHRVFGGAMYRVGQGRNWLLEGRSLGEWFEGVASGDFARGRQRLTLTLGRGKLRPYLQSEGFRQQGAWLGRFSAGVNIRNYAVGYEMRQNLHGGQMHLITTMATMKMRRAER